MRKFYPKDFTDTIKLSYRYLSRFIKPIPRRYGPHFLEQAANLRESQYWSRDRLDDLRLTRLIEVIKNASFYSPFIQKKLKAQNINYQDLKTLKDFSQISVMTKDDLKFNLEEIVSTNYSRKDLVYATTGGTTGIPVGLFLEKRTDFVRLAFEWRHFEWGGYHFGDRCVVIRGRVITNNFYEYDPVDNYLYLSVFDMSPDRLPLYIDLIKDFKPAVIRAYPSAAEILAKYLIENNIQINENGIIKSIFTSSEVLFDYQQSLIQSAFKAKVYDKYGNSEQASIIGMCPCGNLYHDYEEYAYTEIIDEKGNLVTQDGEVGEIVSTPFFNLATPLIRYRTGDFAEIHLKKCDCGREHCCFRKILGRAQDFLISADGSRISIAAINTHQNVFDRVERFRFFQEKPGRAIIQLIKGEGFSNLDEVRILAEVQFRSKNKIQYAIEYVKEFPLSARGKFSFIESKCTNVL